MARRIAGAGTLVAAICIAAGAAQARAAAPEQITQANRAAALTAADRMLAGVVLPAGATQLAQAPSGSKLQSQTFSQILLAAQVDQDAFARTAAAPATVVDAVKAHLPPGAKLAVSASGGGESLATFTLPTVDPARLGIRQLGIEAVSLTSGWTGVRVDAEVQYLAPRPYDQRVPAQARRLEITIKDNSPKPLLSLTVTKSGLVRAVASMVNSLPFTGNFQGTVFSCPMSPAREPTDTFVFRAARGGPVLAKVTELANMPTTVVPCVATSLTIRGHRAPELAEGGVLLRKAGSLLGVKLTRP